MFKYVQLVIFCLKKCTLKKLCTYVSYMINCSIYILGPQYINYIGSDMFWYQYVEMQNIE